MTSKNALPTITLITKAPPRRRAVVRSNRLRSRVDWCVSGCVRRRKPRTPSLGHRHRRPFPRHVGAGVLERHSVSITLHVVASGLIGGGGIRTPDTVSRVTVFKTVAFSHSATPPHTVGLDATRCHSIPRMVGSTALVGVYAAPIFPIGVRFSAIQRQCRPLRCTPFHQAGHQARHQALSVCSRRPLSRCSGRVVRSGNASSAAARSAITVWLYRLMVKLMSECRAKS